MPSLKRFCEMSGLPALRHWEDAATLARAALKDQDQSRRKALCPYCEGTGKWRPAGSHHREFCGVCHGTGRGEWR